MGSGAASLGATVGASVAVGTAACLLSLVGVDTVCSAAGVVGIVTGVVDVTEGVAAADSVSFFSPPKKKSRL